jgi:hypothetical protein
MFVEEQREYSDASSLTAKTNIKVCFRLKQLYWTRQDTLERSSGLAIEKPGSMTGFIRAAAYDSLLHVA